MIIVNTLKTIKSKNFLFIFKLSSSIFISRSKCRLDTIHIKGVDSHETL